MNEVMGNKQQTIVTGTHPKLFNMWLFIVSICMMFAGFTSAYVVSKSAGKWLEFDLPSMLWYSSAVIVVSSITMQLSYYFAAKDKFNLLKLFVASTFVLGIVFLVTQFEAWKQIYNYDYKIVFAGKQSNVSGSLFYVITGLHALHIISAVIFLFVVLIYTLQNKIHSKKMLNIKMCTTYWHFLGGLWIYLFLFLLLNNS
ncbi:MAG: heme-copper oxidase subunit III [Cyclobacteriaceae bacterium]